MTRNPEIVDGRTRRRVGRTEPLSLKTFPAVRQTVQRIAQAERITFIEVIERAIECYAARTGN